MKIAIIGAGSYIWSIRTVRSLIQEKIPSGEIMLMDIDRNRLAEVENMIRQYTEFYNSGWKISSTSKLDDALLKADYVFLFVSIGTNEAHKQDILLARKYGVPVTIGDTYGITGISRCIRHVPFVVSLARKMEHLCPKAWLFNYTNPLTALTQAVSKYTEIKVAGFCHGVANSVTNIGKFIGHFNSLEDVSINFAGIDHCSWLLKLRKSNKDLYPKLRKFCSLPHKERLDICKNRKAQNEYKRYRHSVDLCHGLGYFPLINDLHIVEFYGSLLKGQSDLRKLGYKPGETQAERREEGAQEIKREMDRLLAVGEVKKLHSPLSSINDEEFNDLMAKPIAAFEMDRSFVSAANYKNIGQLPELPEGVVVESMQRFDANGITPLTVGTLPTEVKYLLSQAVFFQDLVIEATLEKNRKKLTVAVLNSPGQVQYGKISSLVSDMLDQNFTYM